MNILHSCCCFILALVTSALAEIYDESNHQLTAKEEIEQIRELARMIRQTDNPSELTVQNLLLWLQGKYDAEATGARKARQGYPSREYLPSRTGPNQEIVSRPRPFQRPQTVQTVSTTQRPYRPQPYPQPSDQPNYEPYPNPGSTPKPSFSYPTTKPGYEYKRPTTTTTTEAPFTGYPASENKDSDSDEVSENSGNLSEVNSELSGQQEELHPPHIHDIGVQCAKDMMTISLEFDRAFNGVIYSKGFYSSPKCRYVSENSDEVKYTFTVSLDSCGTQFIDEFAKGGKAYLENVLVIQSEAGIQEVWDVVRSVRCLWEGTIKQDVSVSLAIGMLSQEVVTFNGDTGKARLDIQLGKGPFAPAANGLVKIGETMTLVVYVEGDSGFDIVVHQCIARDPEGANSVQLFDDRGCVVKPKLFGSFQKTKETGNTGASIIAYAYFNAFRFPDEMDLIIECNVELCKTDCEMCPEPQKLEPGRKRRDVSFNETLIDGNRISGRFRVVSDDDIIDLGSREHLVAIPGHDGICMSLQGFLLSSLLILTLLVASTVISAGLWLKLQARRDFKV